jgi:hypothetical protein
MRRRQLVLFRAPWVLDDNEEAAGQEVPAAARAVPYKRLP